MTTVGEASVATSIGASTPGSAGRKPGNKNRDRTNKRGLTKWEQKILASDVEDFGGLNAIFESKKGITKFCNKCAEKDEEGSDERSRLYGIEYSKARDRVRNKLTYWCKEIPSGE